jgi:hypothetical protein
MASINRLPTVSAVQSSDLLAAYSQTLGGDAGVTLATVLTWLQGELTTGGAHVSQYASPSTGFSVQVAPFVQGGNVFLLLTPAATLAAGTIVLPSAATSSHGQEVLVHSTQIVTALTVNGNGASLSGAPTTLAAGGFFRLRFDSVLSAWYRIG